MITNSLIKGEQPLVYIIILNWNGWQDTLECIESIFQLNYDNFQIILIDNCSTDNSLKKINEWSKGKITSQSAHCNFPKREESIEIINYSRAIAEAGGELETESYIKRNFKKHRIILVENNENSGFAKGSNIGIRYAINNKADYAYLLNNDTYIYKNGLIELVNFLENNKDYITVTSQIRYYDNEKIWHCGGNLSSFFTRKYLYTDVNKVLVPQTGYCDISYASGCSMLLPVNKLKAVGILSEKYFFGEEDFEFALRVKKLKLKMACVYSSIVLHKVSSSINKVSNENDFSINRAFLYYLSRYIDAKDYSIRIIWISWSLVYFLYIFYFLLSKNISVLKTINFILRLLKYSWKYNSVSKNLFMEIMFSMKF